MHQEAIAIEDVRPHTAAEPTTAEAKTPVGPDAGLIMDHLGHALRIALPQGTGELDDVCCTWMSLVGFVFFVPSAVRTDDYFFGHSRGFRVLRYFIGVKYLC